MDGDDEKITTRLNPFNETIGRETLQKIGKVLSTSTLSEQVATVDIKKLKESAKLSREFDMFKNTTEERELDMNPTASCSSIVGKIETQIKPQQKRCVDPEIFLSTFILSHRFSN